MADYTIPVRPFGGAQGYIAGNLGRPPEAKTTNAGKKLLRLGVAVTEKRGGEEQTTWWDVTCWEDGPMARLERLGKGDRVWLSGDIGTREWEGRDGKLRTSLTLTARHWHDHGRDQRPDTQREQPKPGPTGREKHEFPSDYEDDADSLPF